MANKFKHPFGANLNPVFFRKNALAAMVQGGCANPSGPTTFKKYQPSALYDINTLYSTYDHKWFRIKDGAEVSIATAYGYSGPHRIKLAVHDNLPAGAMLFINYKQSAGACTGLKLGAGFWTGTGGMKSVGGQTANDGTGLWAVCFIYNGTKFIPIGRDNLNLGYGNHKLANA